jgi:hypothetical protein
MTQILKLSIGALGVLILAAIVMRTFGIFLSCCLITRFLTATVSYPMQPIPGHCAGCQNLGKRLYPLCSNGFSAFGPI